MPSSIRTRLRLAFRTAAAAGLLATAGASAQQPLPVSATAVGSGQGIARNQGQCPTGSSGVAPRNFAFPASPVEQQKLLQSLGMDIGRETPDGIFRERTLQSINEWRQFYYGREKGVMPFVESLNAAELSDLREFAARVQKERKQYGLTIENATALRFAAHASDSKHAELVQETNKGASGFTGSTPDFLYLVKTHGARYGLQYFMDNIEMTQGADGMVLVRVPDPVAFEMATALRGLKRVALAMEAERIKLADNMPNTEYKRGTPPANIPLNRLQGDLLTLGFPIGGIDTDFGPKTEAAYNLYRELYGPLVPAGANIDDYMPRFADLAQRDARTYGVPTTAAAAIRLAALRTGADFGYMMELSAAESNFDHTIGASTSSATGLYQFTEDTWLQTVNRYGAGFTMDQLAEMMDNTYDMNGLLVGRVPNPFVRQSAFALRAQPHLSSLMSAEFQLRNQFRVNCEIRRTLNRTEMYFGHFLGADGAITFLQNRARTPNAQAARSFQQQADANRNVFYSRDKRGRRIARSYDEVYAFFNKKFGRAVYEDTGNVQALGLKLRTPYEMSNRLPPEGAVTVTATIRMPPATKR